MRNDRLQASIVHILKHIYSRVTIDGLVNCQRTYNKSDCVLSNQCAALEEGRRWNSWISLSMHQFHRYTKICYHTQLK